MIRINKYVIIFYIIFKNVISIERIEHIFLNLTTYLALNPEKNYYGTWTSYIENDMKHIFYLRFVHVTLSLFSFCHIIFHKKKSGFMILFTSERYNVSHHFTFSPAQHIPPVQQFLLNFSSYSDQLICLYLTFILSVFSSSLLTTIRIVN